MAIVLESLVIPRATVFTTVTAKVSEVRCLKLTSNCTITLTRSFSGGRCRRSSSVLRINADGNSDAIFQLPALTEAEWKPQVLESELPVIVEFWAPWCGPCRMIQPLIDELAQQYADKLKAYKVNTDECPNIASEYGIRSIPTVMIFKDGEKKDAVVGAVPKKTLTNSIEKFL